MPGWELSLTSSHAECLDGSLLSQLETIEQEKSVGQIELTSYPSGHSCVVGDLFTIKQRADSGIVISGDCSFLHRVGHGWAGRSLTIDGDIGAALGIHMRGGQINVYGNATDELGCQMRGGVIQVKGNVGNFLGGPMPGRRSGMRGGRIVVLGNAGHHAGHRMRRGTVIVQGSCGDAVASDIVAGTVVVGGSVGRHVAAGMKRGTLILNRLAQLEPARFSLSRSESLSVMRLLQNDLQSDAPAIAEAMNFPIDRSFGDLSAGGRGEVWGVQFPI